MQRLLTLVLFIVLVMLTVFIGSQFGAGDWYREMQQPSWIPPASILIVAWSVVYVLLATSAWMVWDSAQSVAYRAMVGWFLQLVASVLWSWLFFDLHRIGWAMAVMGLWLALSLICIKSFRAYRLEASSLMMPVAAWLVFALVLNFHQWQLNGGGLSSIF